MKQVLCASIAINDVSKMGSDGIKAISAWLRHHAEQLDRLHAEYADDFTANYLCWGEDDDPRKGLPDERP